MAEIPNTSLGKFINGMVHEDAVSDASMPDGTVNEAMNLNFDTIGAAKTRSGVTAIGNTISAGTNILGLHQFVDEGTGTDDKLIAAHGSVIYYLSGSTWTSKRTGLVSDSKARFTNFADRVIMVNGNTTDSTASWTGAAGDNWSTTDKVTSAPKGTFIDNFRSRVWIGNVMSYPSRVQFTDVVSSAGALTWTSTNFIDVSPGDGEDITGIKRSPRALLVFKPRHLYRIFSINDVDPDPQINVGTLSNESVVEAKDGFYFHDFVNTAIQRYGGSNPDEISKAIRPLLAGVSYANADDVCGWSDFDHVYESVGDITVNGVTFENVVFVYTISTKVWSFYSYPYQPLFAATYDTGSALKIALGHNNGGVWSFNEGNDDAGTPISYSLITRWYTIDGSYATQKSLGDLAVVHSRAQGARLEFQVDEPELEGIWHSVGYVTAPLYEEMSTSIKGRRIRFRLSGMSSGEPILFKSIDILGGTVDKLSG